MHEFPHQYTVTAAAQAEGEIVVEAEKLPALATAPPAQFDGPGDRWSPEMLLVGAVADCVVLSFRAIARASKFNWSDISCEVEGTLDRVDRVSQFTHFTVRLTLTVPPDSSEERARMLLEKAERTCLVSNSLKGESTLDIHIVVSAG
ncbi:MAG: OsmC family protein [Arenicellales bacterium]